MKNTVLKFVSGASLLLLINSMSVSCGDATDHDASDYDSTQTNMDKYAMANLSGVYADTTVNGTLRFDAMENGQVKLMLDITVPSHAGKSVAVHIHENGACGDSAKAAGGHWNPTNENHGKWGSGAFHSGDIGNIELDSEGKGTMELETDRWSIGGDAKTNILDKAIIVHSGVDDYTSQPAGESGNRIGCGVIKQSGS